MTRSHANAGTAFLLVSLLLAGSGTQRADDPAPPAAPAAPAAPPAPAADDEKPRPTDLVETTESRLAIVDITVSGPPEIVARLGPADFKLRVNWKRIHDFRLDRFCGSTTREAGPEESPPSPLDLGGAPPPASYLLYFDQPHLTLGGRAEALDMARRLVERLVHGGARAMIASNAGRLEIIERFTTDPVALRAALDRLELNRSQWDVNAEQEEGRVAQVLGLLEDESSIYRAASAARAHQFHELWLTDRSLRRFAVTLSLLENVDPPKVVLYFADILRRNPGEHYLSFFGQGPTGTPAVVEFIGTDALRGANAFDRVVNQAAAQGLRVYTVQPRGLVVVHDKSQQSLSVSERTFAMPRSAGVRHRDAQDTMRNLAAETGGRAFVDGTTAERIAAAIDEDLSCLFLASFDPGDLPRDAPLRIVVEPRVPEVRTWTRGRIVLQSESARLTARLLGAFALEDASTASGGLRATLLPTGFAKGSFTGLLQISVPGTLITGASWELGGSIVRGDEVRAEVSSTVVAGPGVPVVLEHEVRLDPGTYEIVAVAHEVSTGFVLSERVAVDWTNPRDSAASIGPIAVIQSSAGAFVRDGSTRGAGSLVREAAEPVITDRPTALVAFVCRGRRQRGPLLVRRSLVGATRVDFEEVALEAQGERCAQLRDVVPAHLVEAGVYRYELQLLEGDRMLEHSTVDLVAVAPGRS